MRAKKLGATKRPHKSSLKVDQSAELKSIKKKWVWGLALSCAGIIIICAALFWPANKPRLSADPPANISDSCANSVTYSCYKN
jgi:hypothetical protein